MKLASQHGGEHFSHRLANTQTQRERERILLVERMNDRGAVTPHLQFFPIYGCRGLGMEAGRSPR